MKTLLLLLALGGSAYAQNIVLKDGKTVATKGVKRTGDTIMATIEVPGPDPSKPPQVGEIGYQLSQILKIDFPEPAALKSAPDLIAQGKGGDALTQLDPVVKYYDQFREAPGSWWAQSSLLRMQALASTGRDKEAEALAEQLSKSATDPETTRAAATQIAAGMVKRGEYAKALPIAEAALKESKAPGTRALAAVVKGQCLLQDKNWEEALLSFLEIPVFYPGEKVLLPQAMLGESRAHYGMDDLPGARTPLEELKKTYGSSPEAKIAEGELEKVARREKALAAPK